MKEYMNSDIKIHFAKVILFLTIIVLPFSCAPKIKTLYLDGKKKLEVPKGEHRITRLIEKKGDAEYYIRDYSKDSLIHIEAYSKTPDLKNIFKEYKFYGSSKTVVKAKTYTSDTTGHCFFYNREGQLASKAEFRNDLETGEIIFYTETGKIHSKGEMLHGRPYNGVFPGGLKININTSFEVFDFKDGVRLRKHRLYPNETIAATYNYIPNTKREIDSAIFYDSGQKEIGRCTYSGRYPVDGTFVEFFGTKRQVQLVKELRDSSVVREQAFDINYKKIAECDFENNRPKNGEVLRKRRLRNYVDGVQTDSLTSVTNDGILIKGYHYKGRKAQGLTRFHFLNNPDHVGSFKEGQPWSGFVFFKNEFCYYKEGKKDGTCLKFSKSMELLEESEYEGGVKRTK